MKELAFKTSAAFRNWLEKNPDNSEGIWMRIYKKDSGKKSITYAEALDQALCYGWIDSQKLSKDEHCFLQKFTPRRPRSVWSKLNTGHVERLTQAGLMTRAGVESVAAAKADGRWQAAYDSPRNLAPPDEFLKALEKNLKAKAFYETLNRANVYAIAYRLQTAKKPETREKRMKAFLERMARGEKFHH